MTTATLKRSTAIRAVARKLLPIILLLLSCLPYMYLLWQAHTALWVKVSALLGLPFGLALVLYLAIVGFARFLPPLDMRVGNRTDRTIRSNAGNYESTFLKTARESNGRYELIQVAIEPGGGNEWHYHKTFEEQFTVVTGRLTVGVEGKKSMLSGGEMATVPAGKLHYFRNDSDAPVTMLVQTTPAKGLEKSVRVGYGLGNAGQWEKDALFPRNPWHLFLLLGYSETYLPHLPGFVQEPLVNALAKIAQWKGEDRTLKIFFE